MPLTKSFYHLERGDRAAYTIVRDEVLVLLRM